MGRLSVMKDGFSKGGFTDAFMYSGAVTAFPNHFSAKPSVEGGTSPPWKCVTHELSGCWGLPNWFTPSGGTAAELGRPGSTRALTPMNVRSIEHGQSAASGCGQSTWLLGNSLTHLTTTGRPRVPRMLIDGQVAT